VDEVRTSVHVVATQLCARVPGGTGRYVEELVRGLVRTRPTGARVTAVATWGCAAAAALGVDVERLVPPPRVLARLWERGLPPRPHSDGVLHAPTLMVPPHRSGTPLIVTIHDAVPWTHPETLTRHGVAFHRRMGDRAAREAALIVTPTEVVAARIRRLLEPICPVTAVPPGVFAPPVPEDATDRRRRLGVHRAYVLFVGTAEPRKGLDVLVEAMRHPGPDGLDLVVVGPPGWGDVRVDDLAAAAGIEDRLVVVGRVGDDDLAALYDGARVLAMPSRAEGFGFPVVEALAFGVPVVVSDDPALLEVGSDSVFNVPIGDTDALASALGEAAAPGPDREQRVARGRRRARDFDWDSAAARMWGIYGSVCRRLCD
jgi:glycosyltransferase involved in cell wall biosynthesis